MSEKRIPLSPQLALQQFKEVWAPRLTLTDVVGDDLEAWHMSNGNVMFCIATTEEHGNDCVYAEITKKQAKKLRKYLKGV